MANKNRLATRLLVGVAASSLITGIAQAQTAPAPAGQTQREAEVVVVTGIRQSLEAAATLKRQADQVLDVITSEDVGKLPDSNVAEALQRVTGVQITRVFGEGQAVSVRGLQQVRVEVDGRTLLSWSARLSPPENDQLGRSSGLDSVPSSTFGKLEVRKSPLADQVEGGLGGSVNLATPKPFDFRKPRASIRAQGTYSDVSDKYEPNVSAMITRSFADNRVGFLISGEYQERTSTMQTLERNNFFNRANGGTTTLFAPQLLQYENFVVDRTRWGVNGALQFKPSENLTLTLDGIYSELATGRHQDFLAWRLPTSATAAIITNPVIQDNFIVAGTASGTLTTAGQTRNEPTTNTLYGFNADYDKGPLKAEFDTYYSKGTIDQTIQIITLQATTNVTGTYDFREGVVPSLTLGTAAAPFDPLNIANFNPAANGVRANQLLGVLEETAMRGDFSYELTPTWKISAGVRSADLHAKSNAYRSQVTPTKAEITPYILPIDGTNFLADINGNFPRNFLTTTPTYSFVFPRAQSAQPNPANPSGLLPNIARDYDLNELTSSLYAMAAYDGDLFGVKARANVGVRVASTNFEVQSYLQSGTTAAPIFTPVVDKARYTNVLPSGNIAFNVTDDFLVRFSASKTMQRAGIAELAPSIFVNTTNRTASGGNAQLKPPTAINGDVSFEYYTGRTSLISGALFYKDVSNFIASNTTLGLFPGYESLGVIPYTRPDNVASAEVKGFELGVQQFFEFLPAPFDGFGVIANYTYSDAVDSNGFPLVATSKNSYNFVLLYEKGPLSGRIAYNYRDEAVFEFTEGRPSFIDARSQLDVQFGYDINDRVALQFQAQNLMPEDSATVEYSVTGPVALNSYALSETRYSFGIRARF